MGQFVEQKKSRGLLGHVACSVSVGGHVQHWAGKWFQHTLQLRCLQAAVCMGFHWSCFALLQRAARCRDSARGWLRTLPKRMETIFTWRASGWSWDGNGRGWVIPFFPRRQPECLREVTHRSLSGGSMGQFEKETCGSVSAPGKAPKSDNAKWQTDAPRMVGARF